MLDLPEEELHNGPSDERLGRKPTDSGEPTNPDDVNNQNNPSIQNASTITPEPQKRGILEKKIKGRVSKLARLLSRNPDIYRDIMLLVEKGAYDYIVAEAFGIHYTTWGTWLERGERAKSGIYFELFQDVCRARAKARILAEVEVRRDDPKFWLRNGPGKTKTNRPGWTENVSMVGDAEADALQLQLESSNLSDNEPAVQDLAKTLLIMEELGLVTRTPTLGQSVIDNQQHLEGKTIEGQIIDTTEDDDYETDNSDNDKGYVPELDKPPNKNGNNKGNNNGRKN